MIHDPPLLFRLDRDPLKRPNIATQGTEYHS